MKRTLTLLVALLLASNSVAAEPAVAPVAGTPEVWIMPPPWPGSGWSVLFDKSRTDTRQLSPAALDRLDYLVAEFKKRGIDVNLKLNA